MRKLFILVLAFVAAAAAYAADYEMSVELESAYNRVYTRQMQPGAPLIPEQSVLSQEIELNVTKQLEDVKLNFKGSAALEGSDVSFGSEYAYAVIMQGPFTTSIGKQRVRWGTGYMWNPSDTLQPLKNALDPEDGIDGTLTARLEYSWDIFTPSVIITAGSPDSGFLTEKDMAYAAQLYRLIGTADIFLNAAYRQDYVLSFGAAVSWDIDLLVLNVEGAAVKYIKNSPGMLYIFDPSEEGKFRPAVTAGISKRLSDSFFISAEYYYNGWGLSNASYAEAASRVSDEAAYAATILGMGAWPKANYAGASLSYTWLDTISLTASGVYGADDGAFFAYPSVSWQPSENYGFTVSYLYNFCDARSAQGIMLNPVRSALECTFNAYF